MQHRLLEVGVTGRSGAQDHSGGITELVLYFWSRTGRVQASGPPRGANKQ